MTRALVLLSLCLTSCTAVPVDPILFKAKAPQQISKARFLYRGNLP